MKSNVDIAIEKAYDALMYVYEHTDGNMAYIKSALTALKPFYHNLAATYDEERRFYWMEMMDIHFDRHFKDFTPEEVQRMIDWLFCWDQDDDDRLEEALCGALRDCGLEEKVYG